MADEQTERTPGDKLKEIVSKLKEMEHYSRGNMETLSEIWLLLEEEFKKKKQLAERVNDLLKAGGALEELLKKVIEEFDQERAEMEKKKT